MPFQMIRGDITKVKCDAIVNSANNSLLGGGGVDGAIHLAAGPQLLKECMGLGGCETGDAKITKGYDLPAKYVIHTVGPVYQDGKHDEEALLRSCYRKALTLADEYNCESIAFPMISAGVYGYPWEEALDIARSEILSFLETHDMDVFLVILNGKARRVMRREDSVFQAFLAGKLAEAQGEKTFGRRTEKFGLFKKKKTSDTSVYTGAAPRPQVPLQNQTVLHESLESEFEAAKEAAFKADAMPGSVPYAAVTKPDWKLDESFSEMLLRKIDEAGMSDAACYKKANVDKRLFSKIRSNPSYQPKKATALAFAVALRLDIKETEKLLKTAGFALSDSNLFDVIVRYYIEHGEYDLFKINEVLFDYDQPLLGSVA